MKRTLRDMTHSVRSTPLTTISTAALWKNHRRTWCTIAHKEKLTLIDGQLADIDVENRAKRKYPSEKFLSNLLKFHVVFIVT